MGFSVDSSDEESPKVHGSSSVNCSINKVKLQIEIKGAAERRSFRDIPIVKSSIGGDATRSRRGRFTARIKRGRWLDPKTGDSGGFSRSLFDGGGRLRLGGAKPPSKVLRSTLYRLSSLTYEPESHRHAKLGSLLPPQSCSMVAGWQRILDHHLRLTRVA